MVIEMAGTIRNVARVIEPELTSDGAGVKLRRSIATRKLDYLDPFLLFDHFGSDNPDDYIAGFPMHPHRGIETVTYMLAGAVQHRDSDGNTGTIRAGDVQWMTAGGGIMHEEMPQLEGGKLDGFQLWVNLPGRLKMSDPRYQEVPAHSIPYVDLGDVQIKIIAGNVGGTTGAVTDIAADPTYLDVTISSGGRFNHKIPRGDTVFAYLYSGSATFGPGNNSDQGELHGLSLVVFDDGDEIEVIAGQDGVSFLLVSGRPLGEPIARYGPFVMTTDAEIQQALRDLRQGTFIKRHKGGDNDR